MVDAFSPLNLATPPDKLPMPLQSPSTSETSFADVFAQVEQKNNPAKPDQSSDLIEAARKMEVQLVSLMFKTMEKSGTEGGLLGGSKSEGLSHFKDLFFQSVAEEMVKHRGLGLAEAIANTSKPSGLAT